MRGGYSANAPGGLTAAAARRRFCVNDVVTGYLQPLSVSAPIAKVCLVLVVRESLRVRERGSQLQSYTHSKEVLSVEVLDSPQGAVLEGGDHGDVVEGEEQGEEQGEDERDEGGVEDQGEDDRCSAESGDESTSESESTSEDESEPEDQSDKQADAEPDPQTTPHTASSVDEAAAEATAESTPAAAAGSDYQPRVTHVGQVTLTATSSLRTPTRGHSQHSYLSSSRVPFRLFLSEALGVTPAYSKLCGVLTVDVGYSTFCCVPRSALPSPC